MYRGYRACHRYIIPERTDVTRGSALGLGKSPQVQGGHIGFDIFCFSARAVSLSSTPTASGADTEAGAIVLLRK